MKKILLVCLFLIFVACLKKPDVPVVNEKPPIEKPNKPVGPISIEGNPVIAFSDIESGPNYGWSNEEKNKGAAVTIWGRNFGEKRGENYVSIGGYKLVEDSDYATWGEYFPTPFWQKITFWLNDSMLKGQTSIKVTINGKESNELPFFIRDGRIIFVDDNVEMGNGTHNNPYLYGKEYQTKIVPNFQKGDIVYYRSGDYNRFVLYEADNYYAKYLIWLEGGDRGQDKNNPIAFLAYPNEKVKLIVGDYTYGSQATPISSHQVVSGFIMTSPHLAVSMNGDYGRLVGNDIIGLTGHHGSGAGIIQTFGSGNKILGNNIHGGRSGDRLDHAVYFAGAPTVEGSHLGWNYIHDNDFGRGPEIAINHMDKRVPEGQRVKAHFIFSNIVDALPQRATFINVFDTSYDPGEEDPDPVFIYNNLFLNGGTYDENNRYNVGDSDALVITRDHSRVYNNTFYNIAFGGVWLVGNDDEGHYSSNIQNNIFVMNSDVEVAYGVHSYLTDNGTYKKAIVTNNIMFDIGNKGVLDFNPMRHRNNPIGPDKEKNYLNEKIEFKDTVKFDFEPLKSTLAVDKGINILEDIEMLPEYAPITRDIFFRERKDKFDIGAFEYIE